MSLQAKNFKKSAYGTISYLPAVFGGVTASVVIIDLIQKRGLSVQRFFFLENKKMTRAMITRLIEPYTA
ncbi:MAG: hypothetical protein JNK27_10285 [Chitinophagaceae bacterium]|nr:hypothetical protein [Chitinophagaceae bacterium]